MCKYVLCLLFAWCSVIYADNIVEYASFSDKHEAYLLKHTDFAKKIYKVYEVNKRAADKQAVRLVNSYTNMKKKSLGNGLLELTEHYMYRRDELATIHSYFVFPFINSHQKDILLYYFDHDESRESAALYWQYIDKICFDVNMYQVRSMNMVDWKVNGKVKPHGYKPNHPGPPPKPVNCRYHTLVVTSNSCSLLFMRNAKTLINIVWAQAQNCDNVDELRLVYTFRNINVLQESVNFIERNGLNDDNDV